MPDEEDVLSAEALAFLYLRSGRRWSKKEVAEAHGFANESQIGAYESGGKNLSPEYLRKLVAPLGLPPEAPDLLLWVHPLIFPPPAETTAGDPLTLTAAERGRIDRTVLVAEWSRAAELRRRLESWKRGKKAAAARREAAALVERLKSASAGDRRHLIEVFPEFRSWAVAEKLAHDSEKAAAHRVKDARELAELAMYVAERVPGEAQRARTTGYTTGYLANVQRVATEFDEAREVFTRAWELWQAGEAAASLPLAEWRLLDLEASLLREQHQFPEALERLDQAFALCGGEPDAAGRILLKKEMVFYQLGDYASAVATLSEAAPFVEATRDQNLLFALRFNTVTDLCCLERFEEAAQVLPEVREMAIEQGATLHLIRVTWLAAKTKAGQGQMEEAIALLEQVIRDFTALDLAYEAALAALDLAVLWLLEGRMAEVRRMALGMGWIFRAKGVAREALEALSLFCEAAEQETATVELAKRVIADMEKARRSAPPT